jgi:sialidase-1
MTLDSRPAHPLPLRNMSAPQPRESAGLTTLTIVQASAEHPRQSEAAVVELRDGHLLIAWVEFMANERGGEDDGLNRISAMVSRDRGFTWGEHRVLIETNPGDVNVFSPGFIRLPEGEILLIYLRWRRFDRDKPASYSAFLRRSRDEGDTFGPEEPIYQNQAWAFANSTAKRLRSGRIIQPLDAATGALWTAADHGITGATFSDDNGRIWQACATWCDLPLRGAMEAHVEELKDGRLLMVIRTQLGAVFQSHSPDGGRNWSKPQTTGLRAPESCPDIVRVPQTGDLMLTWNNSEYDPKFRSHYGRRSPLSIALSKDEGLTWRHVRDIETDPRAAFSNPGCTFTSWGTAVMNYWTCPYHPDDAMDTHRLDLKLAIFPVAWLHAGMA